jgi:CubicO group peptidase (beta-lactamase class C family)
MSQIWVDPDIKDDPYSKLLTPRLCLSHQTGFANWRRMTGGILKIKWKPGTQTGYSGEGYNYVGAFAERKLSMPFDALAQEMVLDPIGMKETSYTAKDWYSGRLAAPHGPKAEKPIDPVATKWNAADLLRTNDWRLCQVRGECDARRGPDGDNCCRTSNHHTRYGEAGRLGRRLPRCWRGGSLLGGGRHGFGVR